MTETIKGSDLIPLSFSVKPLVGNRSRRQVARLVTSVCVYDEGQTDRPMSMTEPHLSVSTSAAHCLARWDAQKSACGKSLSNRRWERPSRTWRKSLLFLIMPLAQREEFSPSLLLLPHSQYPQ